MGFIEIYGVLCTTHHHLGSSERTTLRGNVHLSVQTCSCMGETRFGASHLATGPFLGGCMRQCNWVLFPRWHYFDESNNLERICCKISRGCQIFAVFRCVQKGRFRSTTHTYKNYLCQNHVHVQEGNDSPVRFYNGHQHCAVSAYRSLVLHRRQR